MVSSFGRGLLVCGLLLALSVESVLGKAHLWLRFVRFDNPGGKGDNGHCCDGRLIFCPSKCDHRFVICVDNRYGRRDTSYCPYGKKQTGEISNQDSIVFGSRIAGLSNPMVFDFNVWPGQVRVKIGVWDRDDSTGDDLVDYLRQDVIKRPSRSRAVARPRRITVRRRVSLVMDVMVYCGPGSYGPTCSVTCEPRNDNSAGYTCDSSTGLKICLAGWTGSNCDVSVDECATNRCEHGATCVDSHLSYTCVCAPGYSGELCAEDVDECTSSPCLNGATCHDAVNGFTCNCPSQWTGVTCQESSACSQVTCDNGGTCVNVDNGFLCKCRQGFAGSKCEVNVDECLSAPCQNDGTCTDLHGAYHCTCSAGWTGPTCNTDIDECEGQPCVHASQCQNLQNDFSCVCLPGYTGKLCDTDINECLKDPCQNGGSCTDQEPGFLCACPPGFHGDTCEKDVDECLISPCTEASTCVNTPGSFRCVCPPDFTGPTCDYQIDDCVDQQCEHNGTCIDGVHQFWCACTQHFTGPKCGVYLDGCLATPCEHGATCRDAGPGRAPQCYCAEGWSGDRCEMDEDECEQDPCANGATCVNTEGSFICQCPQGWTGRLCQDDVNECQLLVDREQQIGTAPTATSSILTPPSVPDLEQACQHAGVCVNVDGGFMCMCLEGWQGERCQHDVDECMSDPCLHGGECGNAPGVFHCTCLDAWSGQLCETDADECERYPCPEAAICINVPGGFDCVCPSGWQGKGCDEDIDECQSHTNTTLCAGNASNCTTPTPTPCNTSDSNCNDHSGGPPCANGGTCRNSPGSFTCVCPPGWSGPSCRQDVDECTDGIREINPSTAESSQSNNPSTTASSPIDIGTEIPVANSSGIPASADLCLHGGLCVNVAGSYWCQCAEGWTGPRCQQDVDECEGETEGATPCLNHATCANVPGGFRCTCVGPWEGKWCSEERDGCRDRPCHHGGRCLRRRWRAETGTGGGVQCVCRRGWTGPTCQEDRNECDLDPCLNGGTCVNEDGEFRCECPDDVVGRTCSNSTSFDEGLSVPLYLKGDLTSQDEDKMTSGIQVFLQKHGEFHHDVSIRVYLQTHKLTIGSDRTPVTQVTITVIVENVTLTEEEVTEIFNRVPLQTLETYLPLPLFSAEVKEEPHVGQSQRRQPSMTFPWYLVLGAAVGVAVLTLLVIFACYRKGTGRWRPRKRSDATVIFSHNGHRHSASLDVSLVGNEYVNTLPRPSTQPPPVDSCVSSDGSVDCTGAATLPDPRLMTSFFPSTPDMDILQPPRSGGGANEWAEGAPRSEATWCRSKEVELRRHSASDCHPASDSRHSAGRASSASVGSLAGCSALDDEEESRYFVNTIYMTIPDISASDSDNHLPPDPNRGALPPPPPPAPEAMCEGGKQVE